MLTLDQDFACDTSNGIVLCKPLTPETASTFKVLQLQISRLLPQLPRAPSIPITIDGEIGPTLTLATQLVFTRIGQGHPEVVKELGALLYAPPEQAIVGVAQNADLLATYLDKITTADPNAVRSPAPLAPPKPLDPVAFIKKIFTKKRLVAGAVAIAGLTGLTFAASASSARALGRVDRSRFLPESDGTDHFDEYEEDDVIDVESVEVIKPKRELFALPEPA